jgi:hypothetical protein
MRAASLVTFAIYHQRYWSESPRLEPLVPVEISGDIPSSGHIDHSDDCIGEKTIRRCRKAPWTKFLIPKDCNHMADFYGVVLSAFFVE